MHQDTDPLKMPPPNWKYDDHIGSKMEQDWENNQDLNAVMGTEIIGSAYKVEQFLKEGGYSKIYKVYHNVLAEKRVLKIMDSDFIIQKLKTKGIKNIEHKYNEIKDRFLNEARLYWKIKHENIVTVYDVACVKNKNNLDVPFLIMPYVKGISLAELIDQKKRLEFDTAIEISRQMLSALETLHRKNIIHRDIKPHNIIIDSLSEKAVLIDFGLAKEILDETAREQDQSITDTTRPAEIGINLTKTDISMGTQKYMSPEQFLGIKNLGPASDIYSFGVVLYEMLTGEVPYMHAQSWEPLPDIRKKNSSLPGGIQKIIEKAMARKPRDRYPTAREFLKDLEKLEQKPEPGKSDRDDTTPEIEPGKPIEKQKPTSEIRKPKRKILRSLVYAAILITLIAVFIGGYLLIKSNSPGRQYQQFIDTANQYIEKAEYEQAQVYLNRAKQIKDNQEVRWLLETVVNKQREEMGKEFQELQDILATNTSRQEKIGKCREFLSQYQNIPPNDQTRKMISEINGQIQELESQIKKEEPPINQIEKMREDYEKLQEYLKGTAPGDEKIKQCLAFIDSYKEIPTTGETAEMMSTIQKSLAQYETEIQTDINKDIQYRQYINRVKSFIKAGNYKKAAEFLQQAKQIKDTPEVIQLAGQIESKRLEYETKNGTRLYNEIKDQMNLQKYLEFKAQYPDSDHLPELEKRVKASDRALPPKDYWDKQIKKNDKGYYEYRFGPEHNGHLMIYIPLKEKSFWIDKYEVSNLQYRNFLKADNREIPPGKYKDDEYPAVVEYEEAVSYCQKYGFKLPTESDWEYAANGGKNIDYPYPWGNEKPDENGIYRANFDSFDDGFTDLAPVKSFEKFSSPFGVVNMAGNVWEWNKEKKLKGGSFFSEIEDLIIDNSIVGKDAAPTGFPSGFRCLKQEKGD